MNYYAPFYRPMGYYNPSIPNAQDLANQFNPQFQQQQIPMQPQMQQPVPSPSNDMIWVLNETEATSYPVAPNNSVTLWDKNQDTVYIKSVNIQGIPSMRILDYTERTAENASKTPEKHVCQCGKDFVRIEAFKELQGQMDALRAEIDGLKVNTQTTVTEA